MQGRRAVLACSIAALMVAIAPASVLRDALEDLMHSKDYHAAMLPIQNHIHKEQFSVQPFCSLDYLACCDVSLQRVVLFQRARFQGSRMFLHDAVGSQTVHKTPPVHSFPGIHNSFGIEYVPTKLNKPWTHQCRKFYNGTLHIHGKWSQQNLFHLFNDNILAVLSQIVLDTYLYADVALLPRYGLQLPAATQGLKHVKIFEFIFEKTLSLQEMDNVCFERIVFNSGTRVFYLELIQVLRRQTFQLLKTIVSKSLKIVVPSAFAAPRKSITSTASSPLNVVIITRGQGTSRSLVNEELMLRKFQQQGHRAVICCDFDGLNLEQSIAYPWYADVLIGIHGAGLTNFMFASPGTWMVELSTAWGYGNPFMYRVADGSNGNYISVDLKGHGSKTGYTIPEQLLDTVVQQLDHVGKSARFNHTRSSRLRILPAQSVPFVARGILGPMTSQIAEACAGTAFDAFRALIGCNEEKKALCTCGMCAES